MPLKVYRPTTPATRFKSRLKFAEITKNTPEKKLTLPLKKTAGRSGGKVTIRGKGGGAKRLLRIIDFERRKRNIEARVVTIEYDPTRSANIALLVYKDGEKRYILAPTGLKVGEKIQASETAEIKPGNALPLSKIPVGVPIHNIELIPGKGGQIVRSAGASASVLAKENGYTQVRLPSGEIRRVNSACFATIGQVGNLDQTGKGRSNSSFGQTSKS